MIVNDNCRPLRSCSAATPTGWRHGKTRSSSRSFLARAVRSDAGHGQPSDLPPDARQPRRRGHCDRRDERRCRPRAM